jgi:hypothetical protein
MAQIDTSMYPQPGAPQNPLQALSTLVGIRNANIQAVGAQQAIQRNQLEMNAQQAVGAATQGATNPDGSFDTNRFMGLVRNDPNAAYEALAAQQVAQSQRAQQLQLAMEKQGQFNSVLGSTLAEATNPDGSFNESKLTPEIIAGRVGELVNMGVLDAKTAASELGSMPTDPGQRFSWLKGHLAQGMAAQQQVEAAFGQINQVDNGAQIVTNRIPTMGTGTLPNIDKQMSPGEAASPVGAVDAEGHPIAITKSNFAQRGQVKTGLSPSETAAQGVTGHGNAQQGMELQGAANEVPNIKAILGNMQGDLKYFTSGNGSKEWKELLNAGATLGLPVNKNAVASQENFNKFAIMLAQRTGQQFGGNGSDQRWLGSIESNPNQALTKEGNRRIINILKGNMDALAAANTAWQNWQQQGRGGETFGRFMQQFNSKIDPRFFQMQYMNPQERQQMLNGMSPQERNQFINKLNTAKQNGWIK